MIILCLNTSVSASEFAQISRLSEFYDFVGMLLQGTNLEA